MDEQSSKSEFDANDIGLLLQKATEETNPQTRATLWGECILYVLSLEDIREGLTFDKIRAMSDDEASQLADYMQSIFEMRGSWKDDSTSLGTIEQATPLDKQLEPATGATASEQNIKFKIQSMSKRKEWPDDVVGIILVKCHFRCCVCPEHRRVADIHHMDGNSSNSVEANGVALCKLCHTDAHTTSTMQRNLRPAHLADFKRNWEKVCEKLASSQIEYGSAIGNAYYMNVHRLDALLRELGEESVLSNIPHRPPVRTGAYDTLWANPKNPLDWTQLLENRSHYESRLKGALKKIISVDLNLLEVGAVDAKNHLGGLVSFNCQFIGRDIPDQNELINTLGQFEGPPPTMRREISDLSLDRVLETCMMLDSRYMYADSSFTLFSEDGIWNGIARLTKFREAIGSHDGHMTRDQLILTPICIATPAKSAGRSIVLSGKVDPEQQYLELLEDKQIAMN